MRAVSKITLSQLSHLKASRPPAASAKTLAQPGLRAGTVPPAPADGGCGRDPWWSLAELLAACALKVCLRWRFPSARKQRQPFSTAAFAEAWCGVPVSAAERCGAAFGTLLAESLN